MNFDWAYPQFGDAQDARKIVRGQAAVAALICAVVTAAVAYMSASGSTLFKDLGIGSTAFLDAAILFALAVGIFFMSRTAALLGFLYYVGNQLYMMHTAKRFSFVAIVFALAFMNGVRGTFAYHSLKKAAKDENPNPSGAPVSILSGMPRPAGPSAAPVPAQPAPAKPKKIPFLLIFLIFSLAAGGALFWFFGRKGPSASAGRPAISLPAPKMETILEFKNGDSLNGEIESETETAIVFKIKGGTITFLKSEIEKIVRPGSETAS